MGGLVREDAVYVNGTEPCAQGYHIWADGSMTCWLARPCGRKERTSADGEPGRRSERCNGSGAIRPCSPTTPSTNPSPANCRNYHVHLDRNCWIQVLRSQHDQKSMPTLISLQSLSLDPRTRAECKRVREPREPVELADFLTSYNHPHSFGRSAGDAIKERR